MESSNIKESAVKEKDIFNLYFKYRQASYIKTITSNDQIYKFKEKIINYEKIFREIQKHKYKQKNPEEVLIFVKENNKTTQYINEEEQTTTIPEIKSDIPPQKEEKIEQEHKPKDDNMKKSNNTQKTFLVLGGYKDIAKALRNRGWTEIKDKESKDFDYIYPLKSADINYQELKSHQMAGHFWKANEITRKANLTKNIRNLYFKGVNIDNFFPRAYCLSEKGDLEDFIEDFKTTKALSILRECVLNQGKNVNKEMVLTSLDIIKRKLKFFTEELNIQQMLDKVQKKTFSSSKNTNENNDLYTFNLISDKEWEIIGEEDMECYQLYKQKLQKINFIAKDDSAPLMKKNQSGSQNKSKINSKTKKTKTVPKKNEQINETLSKEDKENEEKLSKEIMEEFQKQDKEKELKRQKEEEERINAIIEREEALLAEEENKEQKTETTTENQNKEEEPQKPKKDAHPSSVVYKSHERPTPKPKNDDMSSLIPEIIIILNKLKEYLPQYQMEGYKNIWIAKPGGLSRGRGIHCVDQLNDILVDIKICGHTMIQKYIENPLIILNRKFDIRQWVLVTDLAPLTIWCFDTPYLRFGAEDYKIDEFKNIYSHLTNNSIAKYSEHFNDTQIEGDMWEIEQFRKFLEDNYGKDYWPELQEKIHKIVIYALQSAKHKIFQRKNSHEVFGFDLMVDTNLNVYLIEINASPDWTYSTKVTEKLVKIASENIISVVVDYAENMAKEEKDRTEIDTGRMKLVFSGNDFPKFDNMNVNISNHEPVERK